MAVLKLAVGVRSALAQALIAAFDGGSGPCVIKFYDGAQPAGPATAVGAQVLLGTVVCGDPVATEANGAMTFAATTEDAAADASGQVTWARVVDGSGNAVADVDVTNTAGSGVIKMNTTAIVAGGPIRVDSFVITIGGA